MKPLKAIEWGIPCDLSEASLEEALRAVKSCLPDMKYSYDVLRVASQGAATALLLAPRYHLSVELDFQYEPYEWSLHRKGYFENHMQDACVWSPGA